MSDTSPTISKGFLCLICGSPLSADELNLNRSWHFACQHCTHCKGEVTNEIVLKCLSKGNTVFHQPCETQFRLQELRSEILPRTHVQINACNEKLLIKEWSISRPEEGDFEFLSKFVTDIQHLAKNIHYMLEQTKHRLTQDAVEEYRETQRKEKQKKTETSVASAEEEIARLAEQQRRKAERENPKLKDERKAIEGAMKAFQCDEATARKFLKLPSLGDQIQ